MPVVVNLKHIFELLGLHIYQLLFDLETIGNFGEKAKIEKAGNLNEGRSYVIITVSLFFSRKRTSLYYYLL